MTRAILLAIILAGTVLVSLAAIGRSGPIRPMGAYSCCGSTNPYCDTLYRKEACPPGKACGTDKICCESYCNDSSE